jgi:tetratricopeptide (TPR) repeat protein
MYRIAITTALLALAPAAYSYGQAAPPPPPAVHNPNPPPMPSVVPVPPVDVWGDIPDFEMDMDRVQSEMDRIQPDIQIQVDAAMLQAQEAMKNIKPEIDRQLQSKLKDLPKNFAFNFDSSAWGAALMPRFDERDSWNDAASGNYRSGTRAIDRHDYDKAIKDMDRVIAAKSARVDGAYYWKAYAQSKLGRSSDALNTLVQLQREYPQSHWVHDSKALQLELKQQAGVHVSLASETDEDLKLLAINGLMHSEPDKAMPLLEKVLNETKNPPRVRERALFVLARSDSPEARAEVMRVAMGSSNPDLQMKAVEYLAVSGDKKDAATFTNIYRNTSDRSVKRAAMQALFMRKDENALVTLARSETNEDLRRQAIQLLGAMRAAGPLATLYSSEKSSDVRRSIIDALFAGGDAKQLVSLARSESNPELKRQAVERLSMMHSKDADAYLMELLNK